MSISQTLKNKLEQQKKSHRFRTRKVLQSAQGIHVSINNKHYLNFCSNDYLGLANHPHLIKAQKKSLDLYGCGSGASHLICGHSHAHHALEEELADFLNYPKVLLFSSGYMANMGIFDTVLNKKDTLFADKLNHASLIDAGQSAQAKMKRYPHNDTSALQRQISHSDHINNKLIVSDAVFSMDGDLAKAKELLEIKKQHNAWLMLDDAHGFGILGKQGKGVLEHFNIPSHQVEIYMATLGKALGVSGAFIAGSSDLIEALIQFSRSYTYTTAMPPALAETIRASLSLTQEESWRRDKLNQSIQYFRKSAQELGIALSDSITPIQPILLGSNEKALNLSKLLLSKGLLVSAIRPPTVPENTARLRITFNANHEQEHIDSLLNYLEKFLC